ncbi:MAG: hypothetical protein QXR53_01685 [Candidatus Norongarragalinales archaeon]
MRFEEKIGVLLVALAVLFHAFIKTLDAGSVFIAGNVLNVAFSFYAVYYTLAAFVASQYDKENRRFWLFVHMGILAWFFGDVAWLVQEVLLHIPAPFPSVSDVFWVLGYPLLIFALVKWFGKFVLGETRLSQFNVIAGIGASIISAILVFSAPSIFTAGTTGLERTINLTYIAGDFLLFVVSLSIALILSEEATQFGYKQTRWYWMLLAFAFAARSIFDIIFGYLVEKDLYQTGHQVDFLYYAGYLAIGLGAVYFLYSKTQTAVWIPPKNRKQEKTGKRK